MADQKISELTTIAAANVAEDDQFVIVDTSATETKKISKTEMATLFSEAAPTLTRLECRGMTAQAYNSTTNLAFTETSDTENLWDGTQFTPIENGVYAVSYGVRISGATSSLHQRIIDGSLDVYVESVNALIDHHVEDLVYLTAGQTLAYRFLTSVTGVNDATRSWLTIVKVG